MYPYSFDTYHCMFNSYAMTYLHKDCHYRKYQLINASPTRNSVDALYQDTDWRYGAKKLYNF